MSEHNEEPHGPVTEETRAAIEDCCAQLIPIDTRGRLVLAAGRVATCECIARRVLAIAREYLLESGVKA